MTEEYWECVKSGGKSKGFTSCGEEFLIRIPKATAGISGAGEGASVAL